MDYREEKRHYVSFCGSYCRTCDWFTGKIRRVFSKAWHMLEQYGFGRLLEDKIDTDNFKSGLRILAESGICSGCKAEIAAEPEEDRCKIRQCYFSRGLDLCLECHEFPCQLLKTNPGVIKFHCIENSIEIPKIGVEKWIEKNGKSSQLEQANSLAKLARDRMPNIKMGGVADAGSILRPSMPAQETLAGRINSLYAR